MPVKVYWVLNQKVPDLSASLATWNYNNYFQDLEMDCLCMNLWWQIMLRKAALHEKKIDSIQVDLTLEAK